jgi:hypothetical protein
MKHRRLGRGTAIFVEVWEIFMGSVTYQAIMMVVETESRGHFNDGYL